eukprot:14998501-Ditylum_brightwellii.AAC.1
MDINCSPPSKPSQKPENLKAKWKACSKCDTPSGRNKTSHFKTTSPGYNSMPPNSTTPLPPAQGPVLEKVGAVV